MSNIIANPKYKGYYVGNKVKVIDMFTKKQKFLPPEEWVMFKDETGEIVPAIVSEELWDKANAVLRRRSEDVKNRQGICNHPNLLTGKLFCACCGEPYYRRESKHVHSPNNSKWVCSGKIKNGADTCASFPIYESEIRPILLEVFQDTQADASALAEEYIRLYTEMTDHHQLSSRIAAQRKSIDNAEKKKGKLLQLSADGMISDRDFKKLTDDCNREIEQAEKAIDALNNEMDTSEAYKAKIAKIRKVLSDAQKDAAAGVISKEFVEQYIDKIIATPEADGSLRLDIKIFTGDTDQKFLREKPRRTGHTFLTM